MNWKVASWLRALRSDPHTKIMLIGCGFYGHGVAYQFAHFQDMELVVADLDEERASGAGAKASALVSRI